jgi:hypothetical protein
VLGEKNAQWGFTLSCFFIKKIEDFSAIFLDCWRCRSLALVQGAFQLFRALNSLQIC